MRGFLTAIVLLALGGPGLSNLAFAQQPSGAPMRTVNPRTDARMRFGILYLSPTLNIDRLGFDSNVFNSADDPKADFTVSVTPRTMAWVPFADRALLTANASVGFLYYKTFENQRSVNPGINLLGELYARRLTLFAEAGKSKSFTQPNFEIETRVERFQSNIGGGVRFNMFRGLSVGLSAYRRTSTFGDNEEFSGVSLSERLDRVEEGFRLAAYEQLTSLTTVGVIVETREDRFDNSGERDADGYRVAAVFDLAEKALISGTAEIGFRHVEPDDPLVPAFDGMVARMGVSNTLPGSIQAGLGWDRDLEYSVETERPYYVSNTFSVSLRRQVAGQFDAIVSAARNRSTYQTLLDSVLVGGRRDLTTTYTFDIGRRLSRASRVSVAISRTSRSSNSSEARLYNATHAGLSLNYVF